MVQTDVPERLELLANFHKSQPTQHDFATQHGVELEDGQLDTAFDDARADGVASEPGGVVDVQFLHEMLAVFFDGLDADAEFRCDLLIGPAFGNELEYFHLARSQTGNFLVKSSLVIR